MVRAGFVVGGARDGRLAGQRHRRPTPGRVVRVAEGPTGVFSLTSQSKGSYVNVIGR